MDAIHATFFQLRAILESEGIDDWLRNINFDELLPNININMNLINMNVKTHREEAYVAT